jgi:hypothetical protein
MYPDGPATAILASLRVQASSDKPKLNRSHIAIKQLIFLPSEPNVSLQVLSSYGLSLYSRGAGRYSDGLGGQEL